MQDDSRVITGHLLDFYNSMQEAVKEAKKGWLKGEVPVGAVLIDRCGKIISRDHNRCISLNDPTAHAEILVIRKAAKRLRNYRLNGTTMIVTIEPCPMCMGAIMNARLDELVFGAFDPKSGAAGSVYNLAEDGKLRHRIQVSSGIMEKECQDIMQEFFRERR
ncbi:MAG TPA: tRNA adenosine(34) deaminase TadA [Desulfatiglandales bacterium]|nr:tRNA adenosine(34) deaminase TadA [Desulfatiglandales bacterium]